MKAGRKEKKGGDYPRPVLLLCFVGATARRAPTLTAAPMPDIVGGRNPPCLLVHIMFGILKSGMPFNPNYKNNSQLKSGVILA